jgi:DNA invertase Pin-like site-specific DNA recombinase
LALTSVGCQQIIEEEPFPKHGRRGNKLGAFLETMRPGDVLVTTTLDRLAGSLAELLAIVKALSSVGASLQVLDIGVDTNDRNGRTFLDMLGIFTVFENRTRLDRQLDGIRRAKEAGKYRGRKPSINRKRLLELLEQRVPHAEIARQLQISEASVYRLRKELLASVPEASAE